MCEQCPNKSYKLTQAPEAAATTLYVGDFCKDGEALALLRPGDACFRFFSLLST